MPQISVGRGEDLEEKYGLKGTGEIGKHLVGENEEAHAANPIHFDVATPHVMGVFGKRGTGKSYSLGTLAEEIHDADISDNLSTIIVDPMGIYWSMKRPNDRAATMLEDWDLKPKGYDINIFIPEGKTESFEDDGMPYDKTFTLNPAELSATEWAMAFDIELNSKIGILLERVVTKLDDKYGDDYQLKHMIKALDKFEFDKDTRRALENRFRNAQDWGIFGEESTIDDFMTRGEISIIDMSVFGEMSSGWSVRSLVVGLLAKRVLRQRMAARRMEELNEMQGLSENEMPIVWMLIDEAHQFIPNNGRTPATKPLLRWVKIGREPGVSLALCTQQPNKLNSNALSQCDVILSHRLTAKE
ncbi:MAG: ATP-binding protein, partial [Candidatus Nanohalobium sp.]